MSSERQRSTSVLNGSRPASPGSVPYGRLRELPSVPPRAAAGAAAVDPQQVMKELQITRQQLQQVTQEKQRLEALAQQQHQEIAAAMESMEGVQSALTRTQRQLHQLSQLSPWGQGTGSPSAPPTAPSSSSPEGGSRQSGQPSSPPEPNYEFLDRLKRRRVEDPPEPGPSPISAPPSPMDPFRAREQSAPAWEAVPPPFPSPPPRPQGYRPHGNGGGSRSKGAAALGRDTDRQSRSGGRGRKGSTGGRPRASSAYSSYGSEYGSAPETPLPAVGALADADLLEHLGLEPQDQAYLNTLSQQQRQQQSSSSVFLWITVALLLVVGSFGAGFLVVQPFIQEDQPAQPFPQ